MEVCGVHRVYCEVVSGPCPVCDGTYKPSGYNESVLVKGRGKTSVLVTIGFPSEDVAACFSDDLYADLDTMIRQAARVKGLTKLKGEQFYECQKNNSDTVDIELLHASKRLYKFVCAATKDVQTEPDAKKQKLDEESESSDDEESESSGEEESESSGEEESESSD